LINIVDLVIVQVLKESFAFLSANPAHVEFILCGFQEIAPVRKLVGPEYVKQAIEFISNNRIYITPYYEYDVKRSPSISVVSSGSEDQQFIGDYGYNTQGPIYCKPRVYTSWDASAIDTTANTMSVSPDYSLETKLWRNVIITDGTQMLRLDGVLAREGQDTLLYFKPTTPIVDSRLKGWQSQSDQPQTGYEISSSIDAVTIQCKLTTVGDASLHRLLQLCTRYAFKSRRLLLDSYGIQCSTLNYRPIMLEDGEEPMYSSVVSVTAKAPESWISAEYPYPDSAARVDVQVQIVPEFTNNGANEAFTIENFPEGPPIVP